MSPKLLVLASAAIGITPAVLWSFVSLITAAFSVFYRPVSFSFRLYSKSGSGSGLFSYHELPVLTSISILGGAVVLILGIVSISRTP
jgi:hypothetical protein